MIVRGHGLAAHLRGFVFDLDGCVWNGSVLEPGAREALFALHGSGRAIGFLSNNSRATGEDLRRRLHGHGIAIAEHVVTPLEIIGEFIAERFGHSRVLVMGAAELAAAVRRGGHDLVEFDAARQATVVVVGNDFDVSYTRIAAAARAVAGGAPLVTPNMDPRLPVEGGEFLPGCAAFVEAVAVAAGVRPLVVGKPDPSLFHVTMRRMGVCRTSRPWSGTPRRPTCGAGAPPACDTVLYAPTGCRRARDADVGHPVLRRAAPASPGSHRPTPGVYASRHVRHRLPGDSPDRRARAARLRAVEAPRAGPDVRASHARVSPRQRRVPDHGGDEPPHQRPRSGPPNDGVQVHGHRHRPAEPTTSASPSRRSRRSRRRRRLRLTGTTSTEPFCAQRGSSSSTAASAPG